MKIEVLVTTMNATDFSLVEKMNVQTDTILCNQTSNTSMVEKHIAGHRIRLLSTETSGKSINQNIGLFYTDADVVLFADDDVKFVDNYERIVQDFFSRNPEADAVKFYCESTNKERPLAFKRPRTEANVKKSKIMSAGTPCLAVKTLFLKQKGILFNVGFGPGTDCPIGEDNVFFNDLLKNDVRIFVSPILLGYVYQQESTWFKGYDDWYFVNIGRVYKKIYGSVLANLMAFRRAVKLCSKDEIRYSFNDILRLICTGIRKG